MAFHDTLTGLPNRKLFFDRLAMAMAHADRDKEKAAIVMLDLDKFKDVNDTYGHDEGDLLLKASAERLAGVLRKTDTVARFGGDEFVLSITTSIGISMYPDDGQDEDTLVKNADTAMYKAKNTGRNRYEFYMHRPSGDDG
ncbi:MAG: GGDEF domain-containing protein [Syntrophorhabdaceae bacterium]|nr:GGDEF domain-containing protein [Syntrophorhabdaceae bacterium]